MGVIWPKLMGKPTVWCVPMHVVAKKTCKLRRVVDFQKLNKACLRQTYPTKAPLLQCQSAPPNSTKTVLDAPTRLHKKPFRRCKGLGYTERPWIFFE